MSIALLVLSFPVSALEISNRYRSPRNPERKVRQSTELIVLHTTEAPARSSLNKVSDRGECHFVVTEEGSIYRIVDRDREAFHAGRSMWNGKEDCDKFSVGIECVGYHDKAMGMMQINAIRDLVKELQSMYRIPDERVVCHSHVAYGAPNRWQKRRHRGRKRCGMLFAMPSVRRKLGLKARPAFDADTRAGRLVVGDDYLRKVLYGGIDTMIAAYGAGVQQYSAASAPKPAPSPKPVPAPKAAPASRPAAATSAKTGTGISGTLASLFSKSEAKPTAAPPRTAVSSAKPKNEAELSKLGYVRRGTVTKENTAMRIAGSKWNAPDTYYVIRGKLFPGNTINASRIEKGMTIWTKK